MALSPIHRSPVTNYCSPTIGTGGSPMKTDYPEINPAERILMGPGPSDVSARVLAALAKPTLGHLDPEYLAIMDGTREHAPVRLPDHQRAHPRHAGHRQRRDGDLRRQPGRAGRRGGDRGLRLLRRPHGRDGRTPRRHRPPGRGAVGRNHRSRGDRQSPRRSPGDKGGGGGPGRDLDRRPPAAGGDFAPGARRGSAAPGRCRHLARVRRAAARRLGHRCVLQLHPEGSFVASRSGARELFPGGGGEDPESEEQSQELVSRSVPGFEVLEFGPGLPPHRVQQSGLCPLRGTANGRRGGARGAPRPPPPPPPRAPRRARGVGPDATFPTTACPTSTPSTSPKAPTIW